MQDRRSWKKARLMKIREIIKDEPDSESPRSGEPKGRARWTAVKRTMGPHTIDAQSSQHLHAQTAKGEDRREDDRRRQDRRVPGPDAGIKQ